MAWRRWIPRVVALVLVGGGATYLAIARPWQSAEPAISFNTVQVSRGSIAAQVTANGTLSAVGTVEVGAQVSGRVVELHADFNDRVTKGQVIAKLDEQVLRAQIDQVAASGAVARANVKKAEVAVLDAKRQYERQQTLRAQQLIAGATVEAAEVSYETAKAALVAARAQATQAAASLAQARLNLSYATIVSPVDGVVLSRAVDVGQTVAASLQAPVLFTIAEDLARMQIDTAVSEADVGRLEGGMKAQFTVDAFPGQTFEGAVRQVRNAPTTTQGVVTYDAVIDVDNTGKRLRPGMTANVTFVLAHVAEAVRIPNSALRFKPTRNQLVAIRPEGARGSGGRRGSGRRGSGGGGRRGGGGDDGGDTGDRKPVWKLVDGVPVRVMVKPGLTDGSMTEMVEGGLEPGDELVTEIKGVASGRQRRTGAF